MKNPLKKLLLILGLAIAFLAFLNFGYLWKNLVFTINPPVPTPAANDPAQQNQGPKLAPDTLKIESLGIEAPVIYVTDTTEKVFQAGLAGGVVHYPGTALPGELGNVYIFGHSSDYVWSPGKYKTVFALLPRIKLGAEILLSDKGGNAYSYIVTQSQRAAAADVKYLDQGSRDKRLLTLQTSYPVGTALARWIVVGEMKK